MIKFLSFKKRYAGIVVHVLLILLSLSYAKQGNAQIATWDFSDGTALPGGSGNFGASPFTATSVDPGVTVSGLVRGTGLATTGTGAGKGWGGNGFSTTSTTEANGIAASDYVTFSITVSSGFSLSLSGIPAYNIRKSGTGPITGMWQYQIGAGSFIDIGSAITWGTTTTATGNNQAAIDLSGITDLQNVSAGTVITFRIVNWGATNTGGTWYLNGAGSANKLLILNGTTGPVVLPVTISSVTATQQNNNEIAIQWEVKSEINVSKYEIQRSIDGRSFNTINTVAAKGNNLIENLSYSCLDINAAGGVNYYRIHSIDNDGTGAYSQIVQAKNSAGDIVSNVKVYPNPVVNHAINLQISNEPTGNYKVSLYNNVGQLLLIKTISYAGNDNVQLIDIPNNIGSGIYQLLVTDPANNNTAIRIIL
jgi:hypothetical protein